MAQHSSFGIVRSASTWSIVWGVLLILFGMLAVGSPLLAAVAVNPFIASLRVLAGVVHLTVAVAYLAHIGGFVFGAATARLFEGQRRIA